jgi:hypothetical protein
MEILSGCDEPKGIHRRLAFTVTEALKRRFWSRVKKASQNECWLWDAAYRNGYGAIKHEAKVLSAHKVAFVLENGFPDDSLVIAHKCDNRGCCNPLHLEAVTPGKNNRDARERIGFHKTVGTDAYNAVLTEEIVIEARRLHAENGWGASRISKHMGMPERRRALEKAIKGESWKHVPFARTNAALGLLEGVR